MGFVLFFFLSWLLISTFAVIKKELNIIENTFIFLIILILSTNYSWIIADELGFMELSKKKLSYTAYLFNRTIVTPILMLIQLNLFIRSKTSIKKAFVLIISAIILVGASFIMTRLNITEFKKWNLWYETIYYICLSVVSFMSYKLFKKTMKEVVNYK